MIIKLFHKYFFGTTTSFTACLIYSSVTKEVLIKVEPEKKVYFQVSNNSTVTLWSRVFSFSTPVQRNHNFQFIAYGDTDLTEDTNKTISALLKENNYDFIFHLGDYAYDWPWSQNRWNTWGKWFEPITSSKPYLTVVGNHEFNCLFYYENYMNRFTKTLGRSSGGDGNIYYSFKYSYIHFIILSSEHPLDSKSKQYLWLQNELQKINRILTPWVIIGIHQPAYTTYVDRYPGNQVVRSLEPLLVRFNVDLVLAAHDHFYERTCNVFESKCGVGPVHLIIGTAGRYLYNNFRNPRDSWSLYREVSFGYVKFDVKEKELSWNFIRINGTIADSHTLRKN